MLSFFSQVWRGDKEEEGNNNTQKEGEKRCERKRDIFTIKIKGSIQFEEWDGIGLEGRGEVLSSPPTILHHVDNRYRKSSPNTWDRRNFCQFCLLPVNVRVKEVLEIEWHNHPPSLYYVTSTVCVVFCLLVVLRCCFNCEGYTAAVQYSCSRCTLDRHRAG